MFFLQKMTVFTKNRYLLVLLLALTAPACSGFTLPPPLPPEAFADLTGDTPLHLAVGGSISRPAFDGHLRLPASEDAINDLFVAAPGDIEKQALLDAQNTDGNTSLHLAAKNGYVAGVETLIHHGAGLNKQNNSGDTPLHMAVSSCRVGVVNALIRAGAAVNIQNNGQKRPIQQAFDGIKDTRHHAAEFREIFDALIAAGAETGRNALQNAVYSGNLETVSQMQQNGQINFESLAHVDAFEQTALEISEDNQHIGNGDELQNRAGIARILREI
jgi:ankyrin repeat protein